MSGVEEEGGSLGSDTAVVGLRWTKGGREGGREGGIYSGTSDKGPSEIGTTSLQRALVAAPC